MKKEQLIRLVKVISVSWSIILIPHGIGLLMEHFVNRNPFSSSGIGIWGYGLVAIILAAFIICVLVILSRPFYIYIKTGKFPSKDYDVY